MYFILIFLVLLIHILPLSKAVPRTAVPRENNVSPNYTPSMGGWFIQPDPNRAGSPVLQVASFAANKLFPGMRDQLSIHVLSAKTQIVAGINYKIYVQIQKKNTPKTCHVFLVNVEAHLDGTFKLGSHETLKGVTCKQQNILWNNVKSIVSNSNPPTTSPTSSPTINPKPCPLPNCPSSTSTPNQCWSPPSYADTNSFSEVCVTITSSSWALSGALTLPKQSSGSSATRFPAVVIIGGSGPTDMDGTEGPNKPLKDIAWGLSSNGIAVLRFNKRFAQYAMSGFPDGDIEKLTIEVEYTDDTVAALNYLTLHPKIDPSRIFLAGHSEGAEVAPGIVAFGNSQASVKGVILFAATSTSLPDLLTWQYYYLSNYNVEVAKLMAECVSKINNPQLKPTDIVTCDPALKWPSLYGNYYLSERKYDPPPTIVASNLTQPVLVLQGQADYNVPYTIPSSINLHGQFVPTFLNGWSSKFSNSSRVTLKSFPCLNHLFMYANCTGFATSAQTFIKSNVQSDVVSFASKWISSKK